MTSTALLLEELMAECNAVGIRLLPAADGGLTIDAPRGALTPDLLARLQANKIELLELLTPASTDPKTDASTGGPQPTTATTTHDDDQSDDHGPDDDDGPAIGPDGWPAGCIDPRELTPCSICGGLMQWQSLASNWHCQHCDPPVVARRISDIADRLRSSCPPANSTQNGHAEPSGQRGSGCHSHRAARQ